MLPPYLAVVVCLGLCRNVVSCLGRGDAPALIWRYWCVHHDNRSVCIAGYRKSSMFGTGNVSICAFHRCACVASTCVPICSTTSITLLDIHNSHGRFGWWCKKALAIFDGPNFWLCQISCSTQFAEQMVPRERIMVEMLHAACEKFSEWRWRSWVIGILWYGRS
jgi:hypothetical protein